MSSIVLFDDKKDCCGCGACMNVCPKNAIRMAEDFVEEGLLGGLACFSLFFSLLRTSWKRATFKNAENLNNGFFLCFLSYVAVMLSVADISQLLWVIIALYIIYNSELKA